jgi:hypothetical protein
VCRLKEHFQLVLPFQLLFSIFEKELYKMKFFSRVCATLAVFLSAVLPAKADITDGKFSTNQIFDVQYYWSGTTLNASNFIAPYDMNFQHPTVGNGQYFAFFNSTTNPGTYGLGLYNADGTLAQVVHDTGTLQAIGPDALFYVGSGFFGTVITTSAGYAYGQSASFTNMDTSVTSTEASSYTWASTTPLGAGQTAGSGGGSSPTYTAITSANVLQVTPTSNNSPAGEGAANVIDNNTSTKYLNFDRASAGFTIKLDQGRVLEKFTITTANDYAPRDPSKFSLFGSNDGKTWTTIVNGQPITLSDNRFATSSDITFTNTNAYVYYFITFDSTKALDQYADVSSCVAGYGGGWLGTENCNSVQVSEVKYYYNSANTTTSTDTGDGTVANPGTPGATSSLNTTPTVVSTAPGADIVSSSVSYGTTTTSTVDTAGTAVSVTTITDSRGAQTEKTLEVSRNTTVVTTTPVTRVVTQTTPVTTTTVTTPTTVTTWSDGTTTTANGTPVTTTSTANQVVTTTTTFNNVVTTSADQSYYTRIDQYSVLAQTNRLANLLSSDNLLNRHSVIDGDLSFKGNVDQARTISFYAFGEKTADYSFDNYLIMSSRYGFGLDKLVKNNLVVGFSLSKFDSNMSGNDATGSLTKDVFALNTTYVARNWIMSSQLGYTNNVFTASHSLPELGYSNSSRTNGNDYWASARLYTPDLVGLRPFVGVRHENVRRNVVTESGDAITAMSYAAVNQNTNTNEYGLRYDKRFGTMNVYGEVAQTSTNLTVSRVGVGKQLSEKVSVIVGAVHLHSQDIQSTSGSVLLRIGF